MISAIKCKKCGDIIFSKHRHDMVWCKCNTIAIDGGQDYLRITGEPTDFELLQFVPPAEHKQDLLEIRAEIEKVLRKGEIPCGWVISEEMLKKIEQGESDAKD